jgi:malonyl-CoA O-methyltransferase
VKSIGAHNSTDGRARGLMGKTYFASLAQSYEQFRQNGKLPATFEVVYAHAWRGENKAALADGVSPISFKPRQK